MGHNQKKDKTLIMICKWYDQVTCQSTNCRFLFQLGPVEWFLVFIWLQFLPLAGYHLKCQEAAFSTIFQSVLPWATLGGPGTLVVVTLQKLLALQIVITERATLLSHSGG